MMRDCHHEEGCYPRSHAAAYSTNIAAAWRVVEHLAAQGWGVTINRSTGRRLSYEVCLRQGKRGQEDNHIAEADQAPLAICLAALKTIEHEAATSLRGETTEPDRTAGN
jgi:hypothetical protein